MTTVCHSEKWQVILDYKVGKKNNTFQIPLSWYTLNSWYGTRVCSGTIYEKSTVHVWNIISPKVVRAAPFVPNQQPELFQSEQGNPTTRSIPYSELTIPHKITTKHTHNPNLKTCHHPNPTPSTPSPPKPNTPTPSSSSTAAAAPPRTSRANCSRARRATPGS